MIEALRLQKIYLRIESDNGRGETYYRCADNNCKYRIKLVENKEFLKSLTVQSLIKKFKDFGLETININESGACKLIECRVHLNKHDTTEISNFEASIQGKIYLYCS